MLSEYFTDIGRYQEVILDVTTLDPCGLGGHDNHVYDGDKKLSDWGAIMATSRDAEILGQSNWEVISKDMIKRFPDDVEIEEWSHWLNGWVAKLLIRVYTYSGIADSYDGDEPPRPIFVTGPLEAAFEWQQEMQSYPYADEEHYDNMKYEETKRCYRYFGRDEVIDWLQEHGNPLEILDEDGRVKSGPNYLFRLLEYCDQYNGDNYVESGAMRSALMDLECDIEYS